jgi:methanogenic corrinoid protein MtbC1
LNIELKKDAETNRVRIMGGGGAFNGVDELWKDIGADGYAADAATAIAVADSWFNEKVACANA